MITRNFEITIRIPEQNYIPTLFQVVENDKDVYNLTIHITDGINEIDYSQVSSATITFALANGAVVQSDPTRLTVSATGIIYQMGTSEIAYPGKVLASIQLFGSGGERLTTARFQFEVVADLITPDAVQSESRFPILQQLVADVEQLKQDIVDLQIPDGSIMDVKLSDAAGQIKQRLASHMADYASHKADYASAHGGIYRKNLLHNWDFRNPVNQRGQSSYTGAAYSIDRWKLSGTSASLDVQSGNVKLTFVGGGDMRQYVENYQQYKGKTITFSVELASPTIENVAMGIYDGVSFTVYGLKGKTAGIYSVTRTIDNNATELHVRIFGNQLGVTNSVEISRVKLELGSVSTLANDPPADYGEQLALCQRYALVLGTGSYHFRPSAYDNNAITFMIPTPVTMRIHPTFVGTLTVMSAGVAQTGFTFSIYRNAGSLSVVASKPAHGLTDAWLSVSGNTLFSADL